MSVAENWITHAKKIGDATALLVKTTHSGKPKED
jgi:hypothetical protein